MIKNTEGGVMKVKGSADSSHASALLSPSRPSPCRAHRRWRWTPWTRAEGAPASTRTISMPRSRSPLSTRRTSAPTLPLCSRSCRARTFAPTPLLWIQSPSRLRTITSTSARTRLLRSRSCRARTFAPTRLRPSQPPPRSRPSRRTSAPTERPRCRWPTLATARCSGTGCRSASSRRSSRRRNSHPPTRRASTGASPQWERPSERSAWCSCWPSSTTQDDSTAEVGSPLHEPRVTVVSGLSRVGPLTTVPVRFVCVRWWRRTGRLAAERTRRTTRLVAPRRRCVSPTSIVEPRVRPARSMFGLARPPRRARPAPRTAGDGHRTRFRRRRTSSIRGGGRRSRRRASGRRAAPGSMRRRLRHRPRCPWTCSGRRVPAGGWVGAQRPHRTPRLLPSGRSEMRDRVRRPPGWRWVGPCPQASSPHSWGSPRLRAARAGKGRSMRSGSVSSRRLRARRRGRVPPRWSHPVAWRRRARASRRLLRGRFPMRRRFGRRGSGGRSSARGRQARRARGRPRSSGAAPASTRVPWRRSRRACARVCSETASARLRTRLPCVPLWRLELTIPPKAEGIARRQGRIRDRRWRRPGRGGEEACGDGWDYPWD